jgi:hypothetical protein
MSKYDSKHKCDKNEIGPESLSPIIRHVIWGYYLKNSFAMHSAISNDPNISEVKSIKHGFKAKMYFNLWLMNLKNIWVFCKTCG